MYPKITSKNTNKIYRLIYSAYLKNEMDYRNDRIKYTVYGFLLAIPSHGYVCHFQHSKVTGHSKYSQGSILLYRFFPLFSGKSAMSKVWFRPTSFRS